MKTVILKGGLGNQLFEYCFSIYIKSRFGGDVRYYFRKNGSHYGLELEKMFDIKLRRAPLFQSLYIFLLDKLRDFNVIKRKPFINRDALSVGKEGVYDDYWQKACYYDGACLKFRNDLKLSEKNKEMLAFVSGRSCVSLHIRRGDYLLERNSIFTNLCNTDYYAKAIAFMKSRHPESVFVIFSDDIEWVRKHFAIESASYVDWNTGKDSAYDMLLMSRCRHHIIANSTFSYWGARLGQDGDVVYPVQWYASGPAGDMIPDSWVGI